MSAGGNRAPPEDVATSSASANGAEQARACDATGLRGYLAFLRAHPRMLAFGVLLTLFSSFGQTFLIAIFVPRIIDAFGLGTASFGALYAAATLCSAFTLPFFGRLLDRVSLRGFTLTVGAGLALSCWLLATAVHVSMLFIAILGLRLTGQGLLSLTASTAMARGIAEGRGKALSLSQLGYPLGEGLLPLLVVLLMYAVDWRVSWAILGAVIALLLLPAIASLLRDPSAARPASASLGRAPRSVRLLADRRFLVLLPAIVFQPLVLTALFLYQVPLADHQGWPLEFLAAAFIGFALARMLASLAFGPVIDRFGAIRLLPVLHVPLLLGLGGLAAGAAPWIAWWYLVMAGVSTGFNGPMMTALWAEVYGLESLGEVKGTVATFGIFSTAVGPVALGWLLEAGIGFDVVLPACVAWAALSVVLTLAVRPHFARIANR